MMERKELRRLRFGNRHHCISNLILITLAILDIVNSAKFVQFVRKNLHRISEYCGRNLESYTII